jgi:hypothetical protein
MPTVEATALLKSLHATDDDTLRSNMPTVESDALLRALKIEDDDSFKLYVMESLGGLLLITHFLRGIFTWNVWCGALEYAGNKTYSAEQERANYDRLNHNIELYEEILWKIVPPRAMLQQLRLWREQGVLDDDFMRLLQADEMGRYDRDDAKVCEVIDRGNVVAGRDDIPLR